MEAQARLKEAQVKLQQAQKRRNKANLLEAQRNLAVAEAEVGVKTPLLTDAQRQRAQVETQAQANQKTAVAAAAAAGAAAAATEAQRQDEARVAREKMTEAKALPLTDAQRQLQVEKQAQADQKAKAEERAAALRLAKENARKRAQAQQPPPAAATKQPAKEPQAGGCDPAQHVVMVADATNSWRDTADKDAVKITDLKELKPAGGNAHALAQLGFTFLLPATIRGITKVETAVVPRQTEPAAMRWTPYCPICVQRAPYKAGHFTAEVQAAAGQQYVAWLRVTSSDCSAAQLFSSNGLSLAV